LGVKPVVVLPGFISLATYELFYAWGLQLGKLLELDTDQTEALGQLAYLVKPVNSYRDQTIAGPLFRNWP